MTTTDSDLQFKLIIIGDTNVGKSCLLHTFIEGKFRKNSSYTVGVEFGAKIVQMQGRSIKLQIWDTAGQERYRAVCRSYYRGAVGALVVYDTTDQESFTRVSNWIEDALNLCMNVTIMLVGNKADLKDKRQVSFIDASTFAQEKNILFVECSALTGDNVEEAFMKLSRVCLQKQLDSKNRQDQQPDRSKLLNKKQQEDQDLPASCTGNC
jgi:small GTP-binding protein